MIALSDDVKKIYTSNVMGRTLSILDVASRTLEKTIPTETNNQRVALSPDGRHFATNLGQERRVAFYRTADGALDFVVEVDGSPFTAQFSRDGRFLYVMGSAGGGGRGGRGGPGRGGPGAGGPPAARGAGAANAPAAPAQAVPGGRQAGPPPAAGGPVGGTMRAWKIDVASRSVVGMVAENLGSGPGSLAVNPVNGRVYISAMAHDLVSIIDPATWQVVKTIATEDNPDGLFFTEVR
jgi:YVTN family beta-propeller protein